MKKIKYGWEMMHDDCKILAGEVRRRRVVIKNIYGVPRGGLIPAVILSHLLNRPLITNQQLIDQKTLIVDDISDTGETLKKIILQSKTTPPVATLWIKEGTKLDPMFHCRVAKKGEWIVYCWELLKANTKKDN